MKSPIALLVSAFVIASTVDASHAQSLPSPASSSAATKKEEPRGPKPGYRLSSFPLPIELQGRVDLAPRPSNEFYAAAHHDGLGLDIALKDLAKATKVSLFQNHGYRIASIFKPSVAGTWQLSLELKLPEGLTMNECQTTMTIEKEVIADARLKNDHANKSYVALSEEVDLEVEKLDFDTWLACEAVGTPATAVADIELRLRVKGPRDAALRRPLAEEMTDELTVMPKAERTAATPVRKITKNGTKSALPDHLAEGWSVIGVARPTLANFGPPRETEAKIVHKAWANSTLGLDTLHKLSAAIPASHSMAGVLAYGYIRIPAGRPVISLELAAPRTTQEGCAAAAWLFDTDMISDAAQVQAAIAKTHPLLMISRPLQAANRLMFLSVQEAAVEVRTTMTMVQTRTLDVEAAEYVPTAVWLACRGVYGTIREVSELALRIRAEGTMTPVLFSAAAQDVIHEKLGAGVEKK